LRFIASCARRSADARYGNGIVPGHVFDPRKYDFSRVGRLKFNIKLFENQEATSLDQRTLDPMIFTRPSSTCSSCARTSARSTTSITSAIAACEPSVSCSKTSSASAWSAWNGRSRKNVRLPGNVDGHAARSGQRETRGWPRFANSSGRRSCRSSWIRPTRCRKSPTSVVCRPLAGRVVTRTRRIRSPRRAPDTLRPHLSD